MDIYLYLLEWLGVKKIDKIFSGDEYGYGGCNFWIRR